MGQMYRDDDDGKGLFNLWSELQALLRNYISLLPEEIDVMKVENALDAGCGSGQWARDLASNYPLIKAVGLDRDAEAIRYASQLARTYGQANATFVEGDFYHMREFEDDSFDVVHARFLSLVVPVARWAGFVNECQRVCRPGGYIIIMEAGFPQTSSMAWFALGQFLEQGFKRAGCQPANVQHISTMFETLPSWSILRKHLRFIDLSTNTYAHDWLYLYAPRLLELSKPFLLRSGVVNGERVVEQLCRNVFADLCDETFTGRWVVTTLVAQRHSS
jgi:ubiquinone/menaquinone biosynthesis C-methylase UbiE